LLSGGLNPMRIYKTFSISLLAFLLVGLNSNAFGWSWRDLEIGVTTEEELLKFGGLPKKIILRTPEYFNLKQGKPYSAQLVYEDSNRIREKVRRIESTGGTTVYDPCKVPILITSPLQLSEEVEHIRVVLNLEHGKLSFFDYTFNFHSTDFDKKKYTALFNGLLGEPAQTMKGGAFKDSIYLTYEGGYSITINPSRREIHFCMPSH
jgi:hypothetical protein